MTRLAKKNMLVALMGTSLLLAACNDDNNQSSEPPKVVDYAKNYSSESLYQNDAGVALDSLVNAESIKVMHYYMPNALDQKAEATALIMFPKTPMPKDGWRVVVWEHGTLGNGDQCAQSKTALGANSKGLFEELLAAGYVVIGVDYEGSGTKGIHPYLNLKSEALSAIHAVNAFKDGYGEKVNGAWMSVGQSQGGQASLGTAEYANNDANFKGAVAGAPASNLGYIILKVAPTALGQMDAAEAAANVPLEKRSSVTTYATLLSYAAMAGTGITAYKPDFDYRKMFQPESQAAAALSAGEDGYCLDPLREQYAKDIINYVKVDPTNRKVMDFPGVNGDVMKNDPVVVEFMNNIGQPGSKKIDKPILVIQGEADTNVPYDVTKMMFGKLKALSPDNKDMTLLPVPGAGHTQAIVTARPELMKFVKAHMPNPAS